MKITSVHKLFPFVLLLPLCGCGTAGLMGLTGLFGLLGAGSAQQAGPCGGMPSSAATTAGTGMITFSAPAGTAVMLCAQ